MSIQGIVVTESCPKSVITPTNHKFDICCDICYYVVISPILLKAFKIQAIALQRIDFAMISK